MFSNIGFLLFFGSKLVGWDFFKFCIHISGLGFLLLFSRPKYSANLSVRYLSSSMTERELRELKASVMRKLFGGESVERDALPQEEEQQQQTLSGSLGYVGTLLHRLIYRD